jgi:hypothetical protein
MTLKHLLAGAAVAAFMIAGTAAKADTVLGTESDSTGFVGDIFSPFGYIVASDGEASFDPFGAGYDTSDGLDLSAVGAAFNWQQASDSHWNDIGNFRWVLPADLSAIGCGVENNTTCEPTGHFFATTPWNPGFTGTFLILDSDGHTISDRIVLYNDANGNGNLKFFSDPNLGVPEPATWTIMLTGFFGLGAMLRRRQAAAA